MPFPLLVPLIMAGISAAGTAINAIQQRKATKRANAANLAIAEKGFQHDKDMIAAQNTYNDPKNQLSRYTGAGLNPNLIYGSGGASAGNQGSAASYNAPTMQPELGRIQIPDMISMYQDFELKKAQTDNVKAQTLASRTQTVTEAIRQGLLGREDAQRAFDLDTDNMLRPFQATVKNNQATQSAQSLQEQMQRIKNMSQDEQIKMLQRQNIVRGFKTRDLQNESINLENLYKKMRNEFKAYGVESSDHPLVRLLFRAMQSAGIDPHALIKP